MHFYNIDHFPDLPMEFVTPALTTQFFDPKPEDNYTKIRASMAPSDFKYTKFAQDYINAFGSIRCGYMRFEPMSFYDWHTDIQRSHTINFLVTDIPNILTMFRTPTPIRMIYDIVNVDPKYFRPTEVETLLGDATKAKEELGWEPKISFEELVEDMCIHGQ